MAPRVTTRLAASLPAGMAIVLVAAAAVLGGSALSSFKAEPPIIQEPMVEVGGFVEPKTPKADLHDSHTALPAIKPTPTPELTTEARPAEVTAPAEPEAAPAVAVEPPPADKPSPAPEYKPPQPVETTNPAPPAPLPPTGSIGMEAALHGGKIKLAWSQFWADGFAYYKLVRTTDGDAAWPPNGADQLIGAIGNSAETWWADKPACGVTHFYRVFAVRHGAAGYGVLAASNQTSGVIECAAPPPPALEMALTITQGQHGMTLTWQPYTGTGFVYYKVVRSQTNADPLYPLNAGTELLAAIGDPNETSFVDGNVAPGQTWFYRVIAFADHGSGKWAAGKTPAVAVTVQ